MKLKFSVLMVFVFLGISASIELRAQTTGTAQTNSGSISADRVIDKALAQEQALAKRMTGFRPLIETYMQDMQLHPDLGAVPKDDRYFLGKLHLNRGGISQKSLLPQQGWMGVLGQRVKQIYSVNYVPEGFASTVLLGNLSRTKYDFTYVRREFLGEVRCLVFDVQPKNTVSKDEIAFSGRIWIEDQDYNV